MKKHYTVISVGDDRKLIREFIDFPKRLYRGCELWVSMFDLDMRQLLNKKHPFFLHSEGEFLLLQKEGETVARTLVTENTRYNTHHGTNFAFFDFFDSIDDPEGVETLFDHLGRWAASRGYTALCGPILSGGVYGTGILVEGFEYAPAMTMMRYNFPYYKDLLEGCGFTKYVDLNSLMIPPESLVIPERIKRLAGHALLYHEMERIATGRKFTDVELVQISEETRLMLSDARSLGGKPIKIHRMYKKTV